VKMTGRTRIFSIHVRLEACKRILRVDTRRIREQLLERLEEVFDLACKNAKSEGLGLPEREKWSRVASYVAQTINSVASGFDEQQIAKRIDVLERIVDEAKARRKNQEAGTGSSDPAGRS